MHFIIIIIIIPLPVTKHSLPLFLCAFLQADSEICPTPDAPRDQTKAPRLDIYRPAPLVVVDTGRPQRNKLPQAHTDPDRFRPLDHGQVVAQTQTHSTQPKDRTNLDRFRPQDYGQVVAQTQTHSSQPKDQWKPQTHPDLRPEDRGQVVAQTQTHSSQPKDWINPDRFRPQGQGQTQTNVSQPKDQWKPQTHAVLRPQDHGQVVAQTQTHSSQPKHWINPDRFRPQDHGQVVAQTRPNTSPQQEHGKPQTRADVLQTKPPRPQNIKAKTTGLEDLEPTPPRSQTKPLASQEHHELQTESTPPRDKPVKNDPSRGEDKEKIDAERHHHRHRHHHHRHKDMKESGHDNKENKPSSTNGASSAVAVASGTVADEDYAVKYRLGLVPRRTNEPKRKSEYQRQFQWRSFEQNSPLMSATQVLTYKSGTDPIGKISYDHLTIKFILGLS